MCMHILVVALLRSNTYFDAIIALKIGNNKNSKNSYIMLVPDAIKMTILQIGLRLVRSLMPLIQDVICICCEYIFKK